MAADDDKIRVLVVDDHAVVRRGLLAFLEGESDLDVVGDAEGGNEALDLLARLDAEGMRPDVVLMDLQMRPVDGIESTRMVRAPYDDVEGVALTSFGEPRRVQWALEAGASGYLLKDADADEVTAAIRAAHRGELQLDPAVARRLMSTLQEPRAVSAELTARELDVVALIGEGKANKEIALQLGIGERTARTHVSNILRKLGLTSRTQLALWAVREQLVNVEAARSSSAGWRRPVVPASAKIVVFAPLSVAVPDRDTCLGRAAPRGSIEGRPGYLCAARKIGR